MMTISDFRVPIILCNSPWEFGRDLDKNWLMHAHTLPIRPRKVEPQRKHIKTKTRRKEKKINK